MNEHLLERHGIILDEYAISSALTKKAQQPPNAANVVPLSNHQSSSSSLPRTYGIPALPAFRTPVTQPPIRHIIVRPTIPLPPQIQQRPPMVYPQNGVRMGSSGGGVVMPPPDSRIQFTIDNVVASLNSRPSPMFPVAYPTARSTWPMLMDPQLQQQQPCTSTTAQQPINVEQLLADCTNDDDVQILENDGEDAILRATDGEEAVEEAPFCKNCTSEIPLILR